VLVPWIIEHAEGYKYIPEPVDTSSVQALHRLLSCPWKFYLKNAHTVWAQVGMKQGWKFGPGRIRIEVASPGLGPVHAIDGARQAIRSRRLLGTQGDSKAQVSSRTGFDTENQGFEQL
jgi:hypothetical protein